MADDEDKPWQRWWVYADGWERWGVNTPERRCGYCREDIVTVRRAIGGVCAECRKIHGNDRRA